MTYEASPPALDTTMHESFVVLNKAISTSNKHPLHGRRQAGPAIAALVHDPSSGAGGRYQLTHDRCEHPRQPMFAARFTPPTRTRVERAPNKCIDSSLPASSPAVIYQVRPPLLSRVFTLPYTTSSASVSVFDALCTPNHEQSRWSCPATHDIHPQ
jgi:hypothetical protein